jgi:hypothetical protein
MQLLHWERDRTEGKRFVAVIGRLTLLWEYLESFTGQNYRPMASLVSTKNDGGGLGPA